MSRLDELIEELCPDGVEFVAVGEMCDITRGRVLSKNYLRDNFGDYPVYSSQTANNGVFGYINTYDYDCESITWTTDGANAGSVFYHINEKFSITNVCGLLRVKNNEIVSTKFLFYVLQVYANKYVNDGMGNPKLMSNVMAEISIPLPPLPVQQEIVRILDNFTELITEIESEIEARKKQYECYRDKLFAIANNAPRKMLGEIAIDMYRGSGIKRDQITEKGTPCVRYGEIYTTYNIWFDTCVSHTNAKEIQNKKYFEYGDILFAITGESVSEIGKSCAYVGYEKCLAGGDIVVMKHNENPKYIAYALSTTDAQMQKSKGKVKSKVVHTNVSSLKSIEIPVPPLPVQQEIVRILDNFTELIEELTAELEARQKQYEYYRDKLLSFKEVSS
jgi:type I restriction enzyme S subunit